jgi:hypothetical protein
MVDGWNLVTGSLIQSYDSLRRSNDRVPDLG